MNTTLIVFVVLYLVGTLAIGVWAGSRIKNTADFAIAGRSLPLAMVVTTTFATWFGAETVMGIPAKFVQGGLGSIVEAELGGLGQGQAIWSGPDLFLTPRAANALSLALHELATNAIKYGALSVEGGRVLLDWRKRPDGGFAVDWQEIGGPPVTPPTRTGFGAVLLDRVTGRELGGTGKVTYDKAGVRAHLTANRAALADAKPAEPAPAPSGVSTGPANGHGGVEGLRLLIVEDATLLALELEAGLVEAGATIVGTAGDVDEAMGHAEAPLDAAVLDVNLGGKLVTPVAERLAARGVPFVFATGYGERGAPGGFDAPIVRKPYNIHQIVRAVAEAVGR